MDDILIGSNIEAEICKRSFYEFVKHFWECVDPDEYIDSWVIECLCDHLEAVSRKEISDLVINIPPGMGKSIIVSVMFPAWLWANDPSMNTLTSTRSNSNLKRDANKFFNLVSSSKYRGYYGDLFKVGSKARKTDDGDSRKASEDVKEIQNDKMGYRRAVTTGAGTTGARGKIILLDDPNDKSDAYSQAERGKINRYVFKTLSTRNFAKLGGAMVIVMQRLHDEDVAGEAIKRGFPLLCIPMEFDGSSSFPLEKWRDPRGDGEFINPSIFDESSKGRLIKNLGAREYATQYQQKPSPDEGNIIKREQINVVESYQYNSGTWLISADLSFSGGSNSDYNVFALMQRREAHYIVHKVVRGKWTFPVMLKKFVEFCEENMIAVTKVIEAKANGQALIDTIKEKIDGVIPYKPTESKEQRLHAVSGLFSAGNVFFVKDDWTEGCIEEFAVFPGGKNDDQVDAIVQGLIKLRGMGGAYFGSIPADNPTTEEDALNALWGLDE